MDSLDVFAYGVVATALLSFVSSVLHLISIISTMVGWIVRRKA